jgi:hypothetical protein
MTIDTPAAHGAVRDDTAIWRYMDLPRFVSMLASESLWFAKAARFQDDPYEGFCRVTECAIPVDEHGPNWITPEYTQGKPISMSVERMEAEIGHRSASYLYNAAEHLYVNSWCLARESMAMWQIYGSAACGIAVKSSVERYERAVKFQVPALQHAFGTVEYHEDIESCPDIHFDFTAGSVFFPGPSVWGRVLNLGFHKRGCFEHEREWRAALYQDARPEAGCGIECDLDELIGAVYIGPRSEDFFFEVVAAVMEKFALKKPLEHSALLHPPHHATV